MQRLDDQKIDELIKKIDLLTEKVEPLIEVYTNSIWAYKVITGFLKLLALVASGAAAFFFLRKL